jgi:transcriptional regulator with XRE-family HTH domain
MPALGYERASIGGLESAPDQGGPGLSQERLAHDAGVDRSYVGGLERQEENPTVGVLDRLANMLNVPISELFEEPRKGAAPPKPLRSGRRRAKA